MSTWHTTNSLSIILSQPYSRPTYKHLDRLQCSKYKTSCQKVYFSLSFASIYHFLERRSWRIHHKSIHPHCTPLLSQQCYVFFLSFSLYLLCCNIKRNDVINRAVTYYIYCVLQKNKVTFRVTVVWEMNKLTDLHVRKQIIQYLFTYNWTSRLRTSTYRTSI